MADTFTAKQLTTGNFDKYNPLFQIVGDRIYYTYNLTDATVFASSKIDGTDFITITEFDLFYGVSFVIANNKVYFILVKDSQIYTAIVNIDGSNFNPTQRTFYTDPTRSVEANISVDDKVYLTWTYSTTYLGRIVVATTDLDGNNFTSNIAVYVGNQSETAYTNGLITTDGTVKVTITSQLINAIVYVDVLVGDSATIIGEKIRTALAGDGTITQHYTISGTYGAIILTAIVATEKDTTLNISIENGTCVGIIAALTSTDTTTAIGASNISCIKYVDKLYFIFRVSGFNITSYVSIYSILVNLSGIVLIQKIDAVKYNNSYLTPYPVFQVYNNKIYAIWVEKSSATNSRFALYSMGSDGTNLTKIVFRDSSDWKGDLQFEIVSDIVKLVWGEEDSSGNGQIWSAKMGLDGSNFSPTQITFSNYNEYPQIYIFNTNSYYVWQQYDPDYSQIWLYSPETETTVVKRKPILLKLVNGLTDNTLRRVVDSYNNNFRSLGQFWTKTSGVINFRKLSMVVSKVNINELRRMVDAYNSNFRNIASRIVINFKYPSENSSIQQVVNSYNDNFRNLESYLNRKR